MNLAGFNFNKISIERFSDKVEVTKIDTNMDISDINKVESKFLKSNEDLFKIDFTYSVNYHPEFAKIELKGQVFVRTDVKKSKEILKQWKTKKIADELKMPLLNFILRKSNLKSLELEEEMNLPLHIQLPQLKGQEKK